MFEKLLARLGLALDAAGLGYMVIGGQAVLIHGEPRLTRDIDVTVAASLDELPRLLDLIRGLDLEVLVDAEEFARETMVLPCLDRVTGIRVDFILADTAYEREAMARACAVRLANTLVRFASPEDLVVHKIIAGRPRDLEDVRSVLLKQPEMDITLVRGNLREFEVALEQSFILEFDRLLLSTGRSD